MLHFCTAVQVIGMIGGVVIGGLALSNQVDKEEPDFTGVVLGVGVVAGSSWIPYFAKKEMVKKAISVYNDPESYSY